MEIINATPMVAGYTQGLDPGGREYLVVVVKGTFQIPTGGGEAAIADEQKPLVESDTFSGEPGFSSPIYESDFCLNKPNCDVLLLGSAYSPGGKATRQTRVALKAGPISKVIEVVGDRTWSGSGGTPSTPEPFTVMPISYDRAYGGVDDSDPDRARAYDLNPVGLGFRPLMDEVELKYQAAPNTQEPGNPVTSPKGNYVPMSYGPVGRSWSPRLGYAGTYDEIWQQETFPFLPADFDRRYFQAAPPDQQMPYPRGGEQVSLVNLTPGGRVDFRLPDVELPLEYTAANADRVQSEAVVDTIVIEPDEHRFTMLWRASFPLRRNMLEAQQMVIGRMPRGWYRARDLGKQYLGKVPRA